MTTPTPRLTGAQLLDAVRDALTRYVVLPTAEAADAVTLWIAATHAQPAWAHAARTSAAPTPRGTLCCTTSRPPSRKAPSRMTRTRRRRRKPLRPSRGKSRSPPCRPKPEPGAYPEGASSAARRRRPSAA